MWSVIMLMTLLYTPAYTNEADHGCDKLSGPTLIWSQFNNCVDVMLRNKSINDIEISNSSTYSKVTKLDISFNNLRVLPHGFLSTATALQEVHLQGNFLEHLPEMFLQNSSSLHVFRLEGNPLYEIPASVFHVSLVNLTVDCRCTLVSSILVHLNGNTTSAMCQMSSEWTNLKDFYEENCGIQYLVLYTVLPILVLGLIIGAVALYIWKRRGSSASLENKANADKSPAHGQPRYMSRNMEGTATTLSPGQRQDYENVFVGELQTTEIKPYDYLENKHEPATHSNKHRVEEDDIYLESDINEGDQPIYSNTQGIYYNYSDAGPMKSTNKEEDDVYILPDQ
ncbi:leucine-rich repeat-containing protein 25 [Rhinoderma darwinii]|uniref:leucine-rich repeat-containing protein 25 n=1 Tax=Rhinoderma darwinii TaxID=43563 RepID=UPI003F67A209